MYTINTILFPGLLFLGITTASYQILSAARLLKQDRGTEVQSDHTLLRIAMPLLLVLSPLHSKLKLSRYRDSLNTRFRKAGGSAGLTGDMFLAAKEVCALLFLGFYMLMFSVPTSGMALTGHLIAAMVGWFIPDYILTGRIKERQEKIIRELPYILDLLTVSVEAGLDFIQAINRVVEVLKEGELTRELSIMYRGLQMGDSRRAALRKLAFRTEVTEVKTFVSALIQADQLGTGIGPALRTVAIQAREQRSQRAEKKAGEATVKLLLPLMLVFAAVMIMILGPVAMQIVTTLNAK